MQLYCVRHGESVYNQEGRIQGQVDVELSALGRRQSDAVADALMSQPIDAIFASPLRRALETARIVAARHRLAVATDPRLMEIHAGVFQDKLRSEVEELYPQQLARWVSEDPDFVIPGGESRRQLTERGCAAFQDIAQMPHQHVVIVAHGRLLSVTLHRLLAVAPGSRSFSLDNGSITQIRFNGRARFDLLQLNATEHLRTVGLAGRGDL